MNKGSLPNLGSRRGVVEYLARCGLPQVDEAAIDIRITNNIIATVTLADGKKLFLKQGRHRGARGDGALLDEGLFHYYVETRGIAKRVDYLTRCRLHDRRSDVLVLDFVGDSETLSRRVNRTNSLSEVTSHAIGVSLGELHSTTSKDQSRDLTCLGRNRDDSAIPRFNDLTPDTLASLSPGDVEIAKVVQGDEAFAEGLLKLDKTWKRMCLIHADFRMENILIRSDEPEKPVLIDWELCKYGDPAADVGSFMGDLVRECVDRIKPSELKVKDWTVEANELLRELLPSGLGAFWSGYQEAAPDLVAKRPSLPVLSVAHAGAFLLNRAGASGQITGRFRAHDLMYLALAQRFVTNPLASLRSLLEGGPVPTS